MFFYSIFDCRSGFYGGDSFTAAFIASIIQGKTVEEAHKKAVDVSAYVCTQSGAMPELPSDLLKYPQHTK